MRVIIDRTSLPLYVKLLQRATFTRELKSARCLKVMLIFMSIYVGHGHRQLFEKGNCKMIVILCVEVRAASTTIFTGSTPLLVAVCRREEHTPFTSVMKKRIAAPNRASTTETCFNRLDVSIQEMEFRQLPSYNSSDSKFFASFVRSWTCPGHCFQILL